MKASEEYLRAAERSLLHGDGTLYLSTKLTTKFFSLVHDSDIITRNEYCMALLLMSEIAKDSEMTNTTVFDMSGGRDG